MSYGQGNNPFPPQGFPGGNPYGVPGPGKPGAPLPPGTVKNYLVEAILVLVCCGGGIFAIPAIVYAAQVDGKLQAGDYQGAVESSENAKKWCIIAVCLGVLCGGGLVVAQILLMAAGAR